MLGKKEGQESGRSVKSVIAKLNANVLPQKKRFSPPKNILKHSLSMKSPPKSPRISQPKNRQKLRSLSNSVKKAGNSSKAPKSTGTTTSKASKSSNTPQRKHLKANKIRKIVEYFEHTTSSKPPDSPSKAKVEIDDIKDGTIARAIEEKKVELKNAFSILMEGAKQDLTPRKGKLKRLGNASVRNQRK